jgi:predicted alpha/beta superfamily hydrolase
MCRLETFYVTIPYTGLSRRVWVCLPEGYEDSQKRYPVLYMHDGQNLFDKETSYAGVTWEVQEAVNQAMTQGKSEGIIVVGVDNASVDGNEVVGRLDEYSPWINTELKTMITSRFTRDIGGYGDRYAHFLVEDLKPLIDSRYRTLTDRDNTGVAGSSMGGLISLYIGLVHDDVFSKIGAFSTAVWFKEDELLKLIHEHGPDTNSKWYLDIGTKGNQQRRSSEF